MEAVSSDSNDHRKLCDVCSNINVDALIWDGQIDHQLSYEALQDSAKESCELCSLILSSLQSTSSTGPRDASQPKGQQTSEAGVSIRKVHEAFKASEQARLADPHDLLEVRLGEEVCHLDLVSPEKWSLKDLREGLAGQENFIESHMEHSADLEDSYLRSYGFNAPDVSRSRSRAFGSTPSRHRLPENVSWQGKRWTASKRSGCTLNDPVADYILWEKKYNPKQIRPSYDEAEDDARESLADYKISGQHRVKSLLSPEGVYLVKSWESSCSRNHTHCNAIREPNDQNPGRLIKLSKSDAEPHIVKTTDTMHYQYVALSYCWGPDSNQLLTLLRSNLGSFQSAIPVLQLPQTCVDAITFTKALGYEYLWIDALCIIQDSAHDKQTELPKMSSIYANATLTIAILDIADAREGFLRERSEPAAIRLERHATQKIPGETFIRSRPRPLTSIFGNAALSGRAWTLQERALARRVLHIARDELIWECQMRFRRETDVRPISRSILERANEEDDSKMNHRIRDIVLLPQRPGPLSQWDDTTRLHGNPENYWCRVVTEYTTRRLTFNSDKLAAIAGLAAATFVEHNGKYLAGCWTSNYFDSEHLAWIAMSPTYTDTPIAGIPSWSWASRQGRAAFYKIMNEVAYWHTTVDFVRHSIQLSSMDPFGSIKPGGTITISGATKQALISRQQGSTEREKNISTWRPAWDHQDDAKEHVEFMNTHCGYLIDPQTNCTLGHVCMDAPSTDDGPKSFTLLNIAKYPHKTRNLGEHAFFHDDMAFADVVVVLVLESVNSGAGCNSGEHTWRRVGIGEISERRRTLFGSEWYGQESYFEGVPKVEVAIE